MRKVKFLNLNLIYSTVILTGSHIETEVIIFVQYFCIYFVKPNKNSVYRLFTYCNMVTVNLKLLKIKLVKSKDGILAFKY